MAERPLDRLLPAATALVFGTMALSATVGGLATDVIIGRPSSTAGLGALFAVPLVLLAAVLGYAIGHGIGELLRRRGIAPVIEMRRYRIAMGVGLAVAIMIGAALGATPVIRHERLHRPRVLVGEGAFDRREGAETCDTPSPAAYACNPLDDKTTHAFVWNGLDARLGCARDGHLTISDADGETAGAADLTRYEYMREVYAAVAKQGDGREALVVLARLRATGRREMLLVFDADGRLVYEELIERTRGRVETPLAICRADDRDAIVVDAGRKITYRPK